MTRHPPLKVKIQIYCGDEIAMGPGKADLLDAIMSQGSISAAGRLLGMSYRRTWMLVDVMNRCWREPLVIAGPGGAHGGGAKVTRFGREVLDHYRSIQRQTNSAADAPDWQALQQVIRSEPVVRGED